MRPTSSQIKEAVALTGGYRPAARYLNSRGFETSESSIRRSVGNIVSRAEDLELDIPEELVELTFEEVFSRRTREFERKDQIQSMTKVIPVRVNVDGPIGIGFFGDPHLDDDGTDVAEAFNHVDLFDGRNPGLFAACLGDVWNNWAGRLSGLWAQQSTSATEAKVLVREFLQRVRWLFYIHGNHDAWGQGSDILTELLSGRVVVEKNWSCNVELRFPNGRKVKIHAAHGFQGKSMWSQVYGAAKKAQLDGTANIYVGGHTHVSGYTFGWHDGNEILWHAVQVASYKKHDRYAEENGFTNHHIFNCPVAIIDPDADRQMNLIRWEFDPEQAVDRLAWMRKGH